MDYNAQQCQISYLSCIVIVTFKGMSPLHLAAWSGKVEVARLLVEAGAHVNASSDNGDTPLILACQHGNSDVVCKKHYITNIYYVLLPVVKP